MNLCAGILGGIAGRDTNPFLYIKTMRDTTAICCFLVVDFVFSRQIICLRFFFDAFYLVYIINLGIHRIPGLGRVRSKIRESSATRPDKVI